MVGYTLFGLSPRSVSRVDRGILCMIEALWASFANSGYFLQASSSVSTVPGGP